MTRASPRAHHRQSSVHLCHAGSAPIPAAVTSLMLSKVASTQPSTAPQIAVDLGWSPCQITTSASSTVQLENSADVEASTGAVSHTQGTRQRVRRSMLLPPSSGVHWCSFCSSHAVATEVCVAPPQARATTVIDTDWQPCVGSCAWHISTRAQFCVARLQSYNHSQTLASALQPVAPGTPATYSTPAGAFPVLNPVSSCAHGGDWLGGLQVRACIPEAALSLNCDQPNWVWVPELACTKRCGGGTRGWQLVCQNRQGLWLRHAVCGDTSPPLRPSAVVCNTAPCASVMWVPSVWSECGTYGMRTRELTCSRIRRGIAAVAAPSEACAVLEKPVVLETCPGTLAAFRCTDSACYRGNCTAAGDACVCERGWSGAHCDFHQDACAGVLSAAGRCCSGARGASGECCAAGQDLDRLGQCCAAAEIDACRVCHGQATAMDLVGSCGTGRIDASGLRCDGVVDECGVCNGTGTSCALSAVVQLVLVSALSPNRTHTRNLDASGLAQDAASELLATIVPAPASQISVVVTERPREWTTLNETVVVTRTVTADVTIAPAAVAAAAQPHAQTYWLYQRLNAATLASSTLLDDTGSITYAGNAVQVRGVQVLLAAVLSVDRRAVCGNGLCELGELAPVLANGTYGTPCRQDCALSVLGCPTDSDGTFCSGALPQMGLATDDASLGSATTVYSQRLRGLEVK